MLSLAMFFLLSLGLVLLLDVQIAYGEAEADSLSKTHKRGDASAGKVIYERHCHYCHGQKGLGDGPVGTAITPHPADFVHDSKRMARSDKELFKSISQGKQKKIGGEAMSMPRWAHILSEEDIWDVLAYVRELERQGRAREGLGPYKGKKAENEKPMRKDGKDTK
ncbi:MAG: c-type cytochrome [Thermodesulfobacteriota bacterium]